MKATEKKLKLPIRLYDPETASLPTGESEWMRGYVRVKAKEIYSWQEYLHSGTPFSEVNIPTFVLVKLYNMDEFVVEWDIKKFEEEYDKHIEKLLQDKREKKSRKQSKTQAKIA